jgi:YidC/Oxa1 family membrane protein insertase
MFLVRFLRYILEFFYSLTDSYGLSIILLSLTVTIIMLPLFWIAERIQHKERIRKAKIQPLLDEIRDVKNKQEKYYYTKEIYRKNKYSPFYSLTGLLGLLIQVPFFLAAYWMLLEYLPLQGVSFGPIKDLNQPDGLISIGGMTYNLLPFVMTLVNLFAGYLYAKNMEKSEQIQLVVMAFIFLVLLYSLSSALVLYWTMNNVFAIGKNWLISKSIKPINIDAKIEQYNLIRDVIKWLKSHSSQIIFVLFIWSIYFMMLSAFYKINLGISLTTVMSIFTSLFLLEIISFVLIFKNKQFRWPMKVMYFILNISLAIFFILLVFEKFYFLSEYLFISFFGVVMSILTFLFVLKVIPSLFVVLKNKILKWVMIAVYLLLNLFVSTLFVLTVFNMFFLSEYLIALLFSFVFLLLVIVLSVKNFSMPVGEPTNKLKNRNKQYFYFSSILIIISPLIQYYINNTIYFSAASAFLYFIILLGLPLLIIAVINYLNKNNPSISLSFGVFIALFFTLYTLPILTSLSSLIAENNFFVHIIALLTTTCIFIWLFHKSKIAILLFSVVLLLGTIVQIMDKPTDGFKQAEKNENQRSDLLNYLSSLELKRTPNLYYLLYDTYNNENVLKFYDIDNSEQMNYLRDNNFRIFEDIYSIGAGTTISTSTSLDLAIPDIGGQYKNIIMGNSTVDNLLQINGYETHYILGHNFLRGLTVPFGGDFLNNQNIDSLNGDGYSENSMMTILYSTFLGEFKFDNEFLLGTISEDVKTEMKRNNIINLSNKPKFLFYHSNYPGHGSGNCHPNENELYARNLQIANDMMKSDIEEILSIDKKAIIIISGDHGMHRKGDCQTRFRGYNEDEIRAEHILDMYGSFLAVRLPDYFIHEDIVILQNVFINILSYLFDDNNIYDYKIPAITRGGTGVLPSGSITNGKITFGADKGKSLEEIFSISSE